MGVIRMSAYCFRCRTKRVISNPQQVTLKNGRLATRGVCPNCGTKVFRMEKSRRVCSLASDPWETKSYPDVISHNSQKDPLSQSGSYIATALFHSPILVLIKERNRWIHERLNDLRLRRLR